MAYVGTEFVIDTNVLNRALRTQKGLVGTDVLRRTKAVKAAAQKLAPVGKVRGGKMRQSMSARLVTEAGPVPVGLMTVNVPYAMWVHGGTGIYAGKGVIRPKSGQYMIFSIAYGRYNIPNDGRYYYAEVIKGQKPNPFLLKAIPAALR